MNIKDLVKNVLPTLLTQTDGKDLGILQINRLKAETKDDIIICVALAPQDEIEANDVFPEHIQRFHLTWRDIKELGMEMMSNTATHQSPRESYEPIYTAKIKE